jgi:hypothetical protein
MSIEKPVQLSLVDGPFHGTVTPIEAPPPSWPAEAWKVLEVLRRVNKKDPLRTRNQLAMLTGLGLPAVDSALRHLAAYDCARPVHEKEIDGWRPGRRARDIYKHWAPR